MLPPLWASILKALTPKEHEVNFLYEAFESATEKKLFKYDLIAISVLTASAKSAYRIGDSCKELNVPCIMGGYHPFVLPEEAKAHCDSVLLGEAEYVWHKILGDAENNRLQPFYRGELAEPQDFPKPDLSIYNKYWFYVKNLVETVRGCPYNCEFCGATLYSGRKYRYKPVNKIVEEISNWTGKNGYFINTNLSASLQKTKELMLAIKEFNLKWWSACSVNIANDEQLIKLMAEAGCCYLQFGFESLSKETLRSMNKPQNIKADYKKLVEKLHDYNIDVVASFVLGWDTDDKNVFKNTLAFALDADIDVPAYFPLIPFPGTRIFEKLKLENRILTYDWSKYDGSTLVYQPKNISLEDFAYGLIHCWEESYNLRNIWQRIVGRSRGLRKTLLSIPIYLCIRGGIRALKPCWEQLEK